MIAKCSHCKQIFSYEAFESHECDIPINDVKIIDVVYFRDDSHKGERLMTGLGVDGTLHFSSCSTKGSTVFFALI